MHETIEIRIRCPEGYPHELELRPFLPEGATQVNYGQGEGQIRIGNTIWGIYWTQSLDCQLQYEEGCLSITEFFDIVESIRASLERYFGFSIKVEMLGALNGRPPHERFLV